MNYSWIGAVTASGFTASVEVTGPVNIRLAVSTSSDMSSPSYSSLISSADGWNKLVITGLSADTLYYWAVEEGGVLGSAEGSIRTFPTEGTTHSFSVAAASCCESNTNSVAFTRIKDREPLFFMHMGDFHYENILTNDPALFVTAFEMQIGLSTHQALYKEVPIAFIWDDHDFAGGNDTDGQVAARPAALTSYRDVVPHYPISFAGADNDTPISQTWVCGRVRFVQLDVRSEADFANDKLIGVTQLAWLENLIETFTEELMVLDVSVPWIIDAATKPDTWGANSAEREAISNAIQTHAQGRVLLIHGDSHMVAMDDGTNTNFATTPSGPGPRLCCFAPLNKTNSVKGGPFSEGTYAASNTQYGLLEFFDSGTAIVVTAKGIDAADDSELVSMTWKVGDGPASDQIIYWAADVTAADALPADTAAYVETDGANPTRVRLNGNWWNIDSIGKDGVAHTLDSVTKVAPAGTTYEVTSSVAASATSAASLSNTVSVTSDVTASAVTTAAQYAAVPFSANASAAAVTTAAQYATVPFSANASAAAVTMAAQYATVPFSANASAFAAVTGAAETSSIVEVTATAVSTATVSSSMGARKNVASSVPASAATTVAPIKTAHPSANITATAVAVLLADSIKPVTSSVAAQASASGQQTSVVKPAADISANAQVTGANTVSAAPKQVTASVSGSAATAGAFQRKRRATGAMEAFCSTAGILNRIRKVSSTAPALATLSAYLTIGAVRADIVARAYSSAILRQEFNLSADISAEASVYVILRGRPGVLGSTRRRAFIVEEDRHLNVSAEYRYITITGRKGNA